MGWKTMYRFYPWIEKDPEYIIFNAGWLGDRKRNSGREHGRSSSIKKLSERLGKMKRRFTKQAGCLKSQSKDEKRGRGFFNKNTKCQCASEKLTGRFEELE